MTVTLEPEEGASDGEPDATRPAPAKPSLRGDRPDPAWSRPAFAGLLAATAVLYLWGLRGSGWANSYYSASVQAATKSWKAFFFGSLDAANGITIDKSPGFVWPMAISARLFGFSSWSVLVPQALMGVATVALVYLTVRRWFGAGAGLLAGGVLAVTPVAALIFRYNDPDALLTLLVAAATYAVMRALEAGSGRWLAAAGALVGAAFLAKMLQAFLVVPGFALVYLLAAPVPVLRRVRQLLVAGVAMVVAGGWWVLAASVIPRADRPIVGGSTDGTLWNLIVGYNGLGRIRGTVTTAGAGPGLQKVGVTRLFGTEMGDYLSWLLPAAFVLSVVALVVAWPSDDRRRTCMGLGLFGGTLVIGGLALSLSKGVIHGYYTVMLAPSAAATVAVGAVVVWWHRDRWLSRAALAVAVLVTTAWSWKLLERASAWRPLVREGLIVVGVVAFVGLLVLDRLRGALLVGVVSIAVVAALGGSTAWSVATASKPHTGSIPLPGPAGVVRTGIGGLPAAAGFRRSPLAGVIDSVTPGPALTNYLRDGSDGYTWAAAVIGGQQAAGYELATGRPVFDLGSHNGTDPLPTLDQFMHLVETRQVRYFIGQSPTSRGVMAGPEQASTQIFEWVDATFEPTSVDDTVVYDLYKPLATG
jgi:4-amino-4-deoxy-L-arabinose transferase-like glycosyltransferase